MSDGSSDPGARRAHKRFEYAQWCELLVFGAHDRKPIDHCICPCHDLSQGGLSVFLNKRHEVGKLVLVHLPTSNNEDTFRIVGGRIRHVSERGGNNWLLTGLQFQRLPEHLDGRTWHELLKMKVPQADQEAA